MEEKAPATLEKITLAADRIKEQRPAYEAIIDFYQDLFLAQEASKSRVNIVPMVIAPDLVAIKTSNGFPLIDPWEFPLDVPEAVNLMATLADLAEVKAPRLGKAARILNQAIQAGTIDFSDLFSDLLKGRTEPMAETASKLGITLQELAFFAHAGMAPSIRTGADQLALHLDSQNAETRGICPICGSHPGVAYLDQTGAKHLVCSLCRHHWTIKRLGCPLCQSQSADLQHYFYSESEKGYRVDLCDNCHRYLKVVDLREINRDFFPDLELVTTLHLDIKAQEQGYTCEASGISSQE